MQHLTTFSFLSLFLLAIFTNLSCSYNTEIEYIIDNQSSQKIIIESQARINFPARLDVLEEESELVIYISEIGSENTKKALKGISEVSFELLSFKLEDGTIIEKDTGLIGNWRKIYPKNNTGLGKMVFAITNDDF